MKMLIGGTWQAAASGRTEAVAADFLDALVPKVEAIRTGDPGSPDMTMGTLITADEAERVEETIRRAVDQGAKLLTGGEREGAIVSPAVVAGVDPRSAVAEMTDVKTVILHGRPW
jgi:acyl-CoA reductase-like NAD-dependent aldehyde dehydrogenase